MTTHVDHLEVSLSLAEFPLLATALRPFPPVDTEPSMFGSLHEGERRALATVCAAFLAGDDPYLESDEFAHFAHELNVSEESFRQDLAGLGFAGLLGVTRSQRDFEIEMVECTAAGLGTFCREFLNERFQTLLCEVARRIITGGVTDGPTLRQGLPWEPGLLLTHVVETLAADGWLTVVEHFGGNCGWQVSSVSRELRNWVASENTALPSVWTMRVAEPVEAPPVAA